jgi:ketosteroid isomerase-like protein
MPTTGDVLDQHLKYFGENDLDGVVADYSSDAVLFVPDRLLKGPDAIKPFFQAFFAEFAKPGASFSMHQRYVEGEYAYILWSAETADNSYEAASDTFVVRNAKIVAVICRQDHSEALNGQSGMLVALRTNGKPNR